MNIHKPLLEWLKHFAAANITSFTPIIFAFFSLTRWFSTVRPFVNQFLRSTQWCDTTTVRGVGFCELDTNTATFILLSALSILAAGIFCSILKKYVDLYGSIKRGIVVLFLYPSVLYAIHVLFVSTLTVNADALAAEERIIGWSPLILLLLTALIIFVNTRSYFLTLQKK